MTKAALRTRVFQPEFALWALVLHLGAIILLPLYFSWVNLLLGFTLAALTAYSMGIFHHMYLSHGSFKAHPILVNLGALLGTLTWRGAMASPLRYVALHKVHHAYSDQDLDPHSPVNGRFHAFLGWNWKFAPFFAQPMQYRRLTGRHARSSWLVFLDDHPHFLQLAWALFLFLAGGVTGGLQAGSAAFDLETALGVMAYGVFAKTLFVVYLGNLVDVINHESGYRSYQTDDNSTNSFAMAFVHLGGAISWHNNHHAHPNFFKVKKNWWEFDLHYGFLRALSLVRLVSDIRVLDETQPPRRKRLLDFLAQNPRQAAKMILGRVLLLVGSLLLQVLLLQSQLPVVVQAGGLLLLVPLAAIGFHNLALLGHEGTHFNLAKAKLRSSLLGTFFSAVVPFHFNTGFAISHSAHHLWTNTERDPDVQLFREFSSGFARLLLARRKASSEYLRLTLKAALGNDAGLRLAGLTSRELQVLARANLGFSVFFMSVFSGLAVVYGTAFMLAFGLSFAGVYGLSAVRPYLEHAGTDTEKMSRARTFSSALLDFTFGTINYHLAHHLHPRVPAYNLPALHRWLIETQGLQEQGAIIEHDLCDLLSAIGREEYGAKAAI